MDGAFGSCLVSVGCPGLKDEWVASLRKMKEGSKRFREVEDYYGEGH